MNINEILIYQGSLSAVVFTSVLLFTQQNRIANSVLAVLILCLGFNLIHSVFLSEGIYSQNPLLYMLPYGISFGTGPLLFLYVKSLCTGRRKALRDLWWFTGDFVHGFYHLIFGVGVSHLKLHEIADKFGALSIFVLAYYVWKSFLIIKEYRSDLKHNLSNIEHQRLRWLNQLMMLFLILIPVALCFWILLILSGINFNDRFPIHLFHVVSVFWLGIGGIRQPEITTHISYSMGKKSLEKTTVDPLQLQALIDSMEMDKLYLLPDLNIRYLEDRLGLKAKQISELLNFGLGKNFYSFINEYRVKEFKKRAKHKEHLTLVGIALECGFSSKSTFQRVFKEMTGMLPNEFIRGMPE